MTIEELIGKLQSVAEEGPGSVVMLRRGVENWFDEIEEVGLCRINRSRDGLDCDSETDHHDDKVVVIR